MKREQYINESPTPSDVLIFDAPLTNGDLTDHISGYSPDYGSGVNGSVTWDDSLNAYHFYKNGTGQACCWSNLNLGISTNSNKVNSNLRVEFDVLCYLNPTDNSSWNAE